MKSDSYRLYSSLPSFLQDRAVAKIDLAALRHNYRLLSSLVTGGTPLVTPIAVVKADAYGHGVPLCVPALLEEGCRSFAVASLEEGIAVREVCTNHGQESFILVLGWSDPTTASNLSRYRLTQVLPSLPYAKELSGKAQQQGVTVDCQIALDTGMHRIGFDAMTPLETCNEIEEAISLPGLRIDGMYSHFARADENEAEAFAATELQFQRFESVHTLLNKRKLFFSSYHICNSAAAIRLPQYRMDAVRLGLALYGISPFAENSLNLRPVMSLWTKIIDLRNVPENEAVGYGGTFKCETPREIATLPIGYADGFLRTYAKKTVIVLTKQGKFPASFAGRICMDQAMLDVTGLPVQIGDEVCLFDSAQDVSIASGLIPYEILCTVSARVERVSIEPTSDHPIGKK